MKRSVITLLGLAFAAGLLLVGCGGPSEYPIVGTARAAGADGTVTVEEIEGGNSLVTVQMQHLPPPERLGDGLKVYLLWIETENAPASMESRFEFDPDSREARAMATTPHKKFTVKVTAEKGTNVSTPSEVVVAKRKVSQ